MGGQNPDPASAVQSVDVTQEASATIEPTTLPSTTLPESDPFDVNEPDFTSTGLAADGTITPEAPIDPFFIPTTFIGAKSTPPQVDDWQWDRGWISFPEN